MFVIKKLVVLVGLFFWVMSSIDVANAKNYCTDINLRYGRHPKFDRFVFECQRKLQYTTYSGDFATTVRFPFDTNITETSTNQYLNKELLEKKVTSTGVYFTIPATILRIFEYNNKIVIDVAPYKKNTNKKISSMQKTNSNTTKMEANNKPIENIESNYTNNFSEDTKENKAIADELNFNWDKDVGLAVFERDNKTWLVFDAYKEWDLESIKEAGSRFIENIEIIENSNITAFMLSLKGNPYIRTKKDGFNWNVIISENTTDEEKIDNLDILNVFDDNNAHIEIPTKSAKNIIMTLAPDSGDLLVIAPLYVANSGYDNTYKYVDLKIIPSTQGFVMEAYADDILVSKEKDALAIRAADRGLNITPNLDELKKQATENE